MAGERTGIDILIQIEKGSDFVTLGGQRGLSLDRTTNIVSANHKTSGGWDMNLPTTIGWAIDADAIWLASDDAYDELEDAWRNRVPVRVRIKDGNKTQTGLAYISDFPIEAPHDDVATVSISLTGNGELTAGTAGSG